MEIIVTTRKDLEEIVQSAIKREMDNFRKDEPEKLYTINQVAKRLGLSHSTVKNKVTAGLIRATPDNLIPEGSLNDYLNSINKPP
jgi:hypothetical protein